MTICVWPRNGTVTLTACLAMAMTCSFNQSAKAMEYTVDVPQLIGMHGHAPYTVVEVDQDLPSAFSKIDSSILRLRGEHFPGIGVNFQTNFQGPVGAILLLEDSSPENPFTPYPYFEYSLAADLYEFNLDIPIGVAYQAIPDFQQWLDGSAEFTFSVGPPMTTGGYAQWPLVHIDSAELILSGQPLTVPEPAAASLLLIVLAISAMTFRARLL